MIPAAKFFRRQNKTSRVVFSFFSPRPLPAALLLALAAAAPAVGQEAAQFYRQNCASCHTIGGGRLAGPDLKNVEERKDRDWLTRFMLDPPAVLQSGDPYAAQLQQEARGVVMPTGRSSTATAGSTTRSCAARTA
jgi:mono/diheme cytochrome c family protein